MAQLSCRSGKTSAKCRNSGARLLYYALAAVAIFALLVGCSVRVQRPRDPATLHFFWLTAAFFGVCGFSYSGRCTRTEQPTCSAKIATAASA